MPVLDEALEAVIQLLNNLGLFSTVLLGPLTPQPGIAVNMGPTAPESVYLDKNAYIPMDATINARHPDLRLLSNTMNTIHSSLTRRKTYPSGDGWQIVDITTQTLPQVIGREPNNDWLMASALSVKVYQYAD